MDESYSRLISSERVTPRTRRVLLDRIDANHEAVYLERLTHDDSLRVLSAVVDRLIPQDNSTDRVEIAFAILSRRKKQHGDGWRFAAMPPDTIALQSGLDSLDMSSLREYSSRFSDLNHAQQDQLLNRIQQGDVQWVEVDPKLWFRELLAEAVELYVSHPATLASIGFDGIAFLPQSADPKLRSCSNSAPVST